MRLIRLFSSIGGGLIGFIFKLLLFMMLFVFIIAFVVLLVVYWPFTIALLIGLLLSEQMYKRVSKWLNIRLPKYFYINFVDFLSTFTHGDGEIEILRNELQQKRSKARKQLVDMENASHSIDAQLAQVKIKRSLKTLFARNAETVSPRAAKALAMELGKPRWTQYIEKANRSPNGEWDKLMA